MNDDQQTEISTTADCKIRSAWPTAPSLKPGMAIAEAAAEGQPEACAIRDAWQLRESRASIVNMNWTKERLEEEVEKRTLNFGGW